MTYILPDENSEYPVTFVAGCFNLEFAYDRDNRVAGITYDGSSHKMNYIYDELGRVASRVVECGADAGKLTSTYEYVDGGYGTNSTTPLVKKIAQNGVSFEYEYDTRGNITSEKRGNLTTTYQYDALGQLVRVNDPHENATWVYNYDRGGNIISKVKYAYTTGAVGTAIETIPYVYGDSNWKDKLTSYNGQTITYDAIGNPLNDGTWTYTWQAGRQLKQMSAEGTSVSFKYDHNGMLVQKVVEQSWYPETANYTYHGKLLTHMTVDYTDFDEVAHQDEMHFFYDAQSRPAKVSYNGVIYTYAHNLQGDVVGLLDNSGNLVVEYKYDAWGRLLSTTGALADTLGKRNPFRYRGYVFDEETGLCYLRNRYYNPITSRLISPDVYADASESSMFFGIYCYCLNKPVKLYDSDGCWPFFADLCKAVAVTALIVAGAALVVAATPVAAVVAGASVVSTSGALSVAGVAMGTAIVATGAGIIYEAQKRKPVNLPAAKRITLDLDHIMSGHGSGGNRGGPNKDRFPKWVTPTIAEQIIRTAYRYGEKIRTQGDRVLIRGPWDGSRFIEMWVNTTTKMIESAWPKVISGK